MMKLIKLSLVIIATLFTMNPSLSQASTAKENFTWYCAQCHNDNGKGDGINSVDELPVGPMDLTNPKELAKFTNAQIIKTLTHGGPVNTLDSLMPPWGNRLKTEEIKALMLYVRKFCVSKGCP